MKSFVDKISLFILTNNFVSGRARSYIQRFKCPSCDKSYTMKSNLSRHVRIECGKEKKIHCPLCLGRFFYKSELKGHLMNKHKVKLGEL